MMVTMFIVIWIICAILSYGISFAFLQGPPGQCSPHVYYSDLTKSIIMSVILGPIALLGVLFISNVYKDGLRFW